MTKQSKLEIFLSTFGSNKKSLWGMFEKSYKKRKRQEARRQKRATQYYNFTIKQKALRQKDVKQEQFWNDSSISKKVLEKRARDQTQIVYELRLEKEHKFLSHYQEKAGIQKIRRRVNPNPMRISLPKNASPSQRLTWIQYTNGTQIGWRIVKGTIDDFIFEMIDPRGKKYHWVELDDGTPVGWLSEEESFNGDLYEMIGPDFDDLYYLAFSNEEIDTALEMDHFYF